MMRHKRVRMTYGEYRRWFDDFHNGGLTIMNPLKIWVDDVMFEEWNVEWEKDEWNGRPYGMDRMVVVMLREVRK